MKTAAVICEFNPFHNGHSHIFSKLRSEHNADYIVALMSGNFVQRGEPAVLDKITRTKMALTGNSEDGTYADLVLEIPTIFSTASAREFASAGVNMALRSGIIDFLGFGLEHNVTIEELESYADKISMAENSDIMAEMLKAGKSYPDAMTSALSYSGVNLSDARLSSANNILGAEYIRALKKFDKDSTITAVGIERIGDTYSENELKDTEYCSASALRSELLKNGFTDGLKAYVPCGIRNLYSELSHFNDPDAFSNLLSYRLLQAKYNGLDLAEYSDVSDDIASRLIKSADKKMTFTERIQLVKPKQYTYTRISRALLHIVLDIKKDEIESAKKDGYISYLRILGFRKDSVSLLSELKKHSGVPVISKTADYRDILNKEIYCSQLYYTVFNGRNEFEFSPVIV